MKCDKCDNQARFRVFAAYPARGPEPDLVTHYPAPMIRDCGEHLALRLRSDQEGSPGATPGYYVAVIATKVEP